MDSEKYWEQRKAREMYEYMEQAEQAAEEIEAVYRRASVYIQQEAKKVFDKFQNNYSLSRQEAELLLKKLRSPDDINRLRQMLKSEPDNEKYKMMLESQAYKARIDNMANLFGQLDSIILPMIAEERKRQAILYEKLAEEAYYKTIFDIQQYAGYGFNFKALDRKNIERVLNTRWSGKNFSQRIWENTNDLAEAVKEEVLLNLLTGRPLKKAQDSINDRFHTGASNARRLMRTESCYVCNQLHLKGYEACGVEKYIYLAILDLKTSQVCRSLDKKRFPVSEAQAGKNLPPMHPYCRSTTIADIPDGLLKKLKQSAVDPATGERITVPGNMTYKEWYEKYVEGKDGVIAKQKAVKNTSSDKEQYEKYREIFGSEIPDTLEKFRDLKYNNTSEWEQLKAEKQDRLNAMEFSEMQGLVGRLGNKETRLWYKSHIEKIPELVDQSLPMEHIARESCELRRTYKKQARKLMKDVEERERLDKDYPVKTYEELLSYKMNEKHLSYEDAVRDIAGTAVKSNKEVNKSLGVE